MFANYCMREELVRYVEPFFWLFFINGALKIVSFCFLIRKKIMIAVKENQKKRGSFSWGGGGCGGFLIFFYALFVFDIWILLRNL